MLIWQVWGKNWAQERTFIQILAVLGIPACTFYGHTVKAHKPDNVLINQMVDLKNFILHI